MSFSRDVRRLNPGIRSARRNKFNARRTFCDGFWFHSAGEAQRWGDLKLLAGQGKIEKLERQVKYKFEVNKVKITTYIADFTYFENDKLVVEDFKGKRTDIYKIKRNLMLACHKIKIYETTKADL